jgi:hypothetical protein
MRPFASVLCSLGGQPVVICNVVASGTEVVTSEAEVVLLA